MATATPALVRAALVATLAAAVALHLDSGVYEAIYKKVWPPSWESAPFLIGCCIFTLAIMVLSFRASSKSKAQQLAIEKKRKLIVAQLSSAMKWDQDDDDEEREKDKGKDGEEKDKDGEDKDKEKKDKKDKKPPESPELFKMIFDDIEECHVTDFGIDKEDFAYAGILALFKERLQPDLEEAARCTRLARGAGTQEDEAQKDDPKRIALFRDGAKLKELIELYEKKIKKNFGELVPADTFKAAKASLAALDKEARQGAVAILWDLLRPHLPLYSFAMLLMVFDSSVGAATWHGISSLLDGVADGSMSLTQLRQTCYQTYAVFILCVFSHLTSWAFTNKCTSRFTSSVRSRVLRGVLRQDTVFFDVYPSGVIQERINNDATELSSKCFHLPLHLIHCVFMIISNSAAVYFIKPKLLVITILPIPVIALVQRYFIKMMDRMHNRSRKVAEHVVANTNEMIKELRTVRSFAMEEEEAENYDVAVQYKTGIEEWASVVFHCAFIAPLVLMFIATRVLATYAGGVYVAEKLITVGMAVQVGMAADHLQHCFREILDMIPNFIKVLNPIGRVCDSINTQGRIEPYPGGPPKLTVDIKGRIEFRDVDFTFPSEPQKQILHKLSFVADAGSKVAFVGATGCGKSTSIQIIQRFYAQSSGTVLLDGRDIEKYDVHHLRRAISVVAQDNVLFSTTIRENITYGLPRETRNAITDTQVEDACKKANAWSFINEFPRKLETYCGERGVKLSGGQKQAAE